MVNFYDIAYGIAVGISAPWWLIRPSARRKVLAAFSQRMGRIPPRPGSNPAVMIHAVSLGEINATRGLVTRLREARPDLDIIVSATTETGFARACELYARPGTTPTATVIRYPLDFSSAIDRVLDNLRPSAVVLLELEAWPNFVRHCRDRSIPVLLVNGRITEPSFRRYRLAGPVVKRMFSRLTTVCAQEQVYADRFARLGVDPGRLCVTGTMKFDTATIADRVDGDRELAQDLGIAPDDRLWVCGSTGPGEEQIILDAFGALSREFPNLRLAIIPRKPERFGEVADLVQKRGFALLRRSKRESPPAGETPVILGDTMGELRKFYSLAEVVFVGRTLVDLGSRQHGSDMIEPAALARPVVVGPFTGNFAEVMSRFRAGRGIVEVTRAPDLCNATRKLLASPQEAAEMARRAQEVVRQEKGATERHAQAVLKVLRPGSGSL